MTLCPSVRVCEVTCLFPFQECFGAQAHFYNHVAFQVALKPLLFVRICQKTYSNVTVKRPLQPYHNCNLYVANASCPLTLVSQIWLANLEFSLVRLSLDNRSSAHDANEAAFFLSTHSFVYTTDGQRPSLIPCSNELPIAETLSEIALAFVVSKVRLRKCSAPYCERAKLTKVD